MKKFVLIMAVMLLLGACAAKTPAADVSDPSEVYSAMTEVTDLSEMFPMTADDLLFMIGIEPEWYTASASYMSGEGTSPEEVIILRAADQSAADDIMEMLQSRLQYKQDSAAQYLTENQPILEKGIVRMDGLTVSLIVLADIESALSVYP